MQQLKSWENTQHGESKDRSDHGNPEQLSFRHRRIPFNPSAGFTEIEE
jgi:hypothetical protein